MIEKDNYEVLNSRIKELDAIIRKQNTKIDDLTAALQYINKVLVQLCNYAEIDITDLLDMIEEELDEYN